ncbi:MULTISPECIES: methyltransferase [Acidobacteriaceae]|uniref:methyltransferase n=1 Tax=Acidobacteriaceae TaxID=204434 RepID=UPI00131AF125|nr:MULTISPECIES: methyltransferase [Acidobacteriaceae]MDW5264346.1 methyltransferase [Edaphobacter sp.]
MSAIGNVTANTELVDMAMSYSRSCILCAAARLGIADALGNDERTVEEVAQACNADAASLYRLLRALAVLGITTESVPRRFALTPFGQPLRKDAPNSVWASVVFWSDLLADSWSHLTECIRTGNTAMQIMQQKGITSRWATAPDANAIFRAVMGTAPAEDYLPITKQWDFASRQVIADLGGGGGSLLAAILSTSPQLQGMLVDRSESIEAAKPRFQNNDLATRCKLIAADLSTEVPRGADTYILKHVLHGYTDTAAAELLRNCRNVMDGDARLLIIEFVLPDVISEPNPQLQGRFFSDINMLAVTGGKERSAVEWSTLLQASGFTIVQFIPVAEMDISIIEARTAS